MKKEAERQLLEEFLSHSTHSLTGAIENSEEPDFLIRDVGAVVGIELTQFFVEPQTGQRPLQEQEALQRRAIEAARQLAQEKGTPPLHVSVHFNCVTRLDKPAVQPLAQKLADIVAVHVPHENEMIELSGDEDELDDLLNDHITAISIFRSPNLTVACWHAPGAAFIPRVGPKELQAIIAMKNSRYPIYRQKCDSVWLVIVANGSSISSWIDIDPSTGSNSFESRFDAVFLYRRAFQQVTELRRSPTALSN